MISIFNGILEFQRPDRKLVAGTGHTDYKIVKVSGLTGLDFDITSVSNPFVPGVRVTNKKPLARIIDIELDCAIELRQSAISFFNPRYEGKLIATVNGVTRWISYIPYPSALSEKNIYSKERVKIRLMCPNPYMKDMSNYGKDITFRQSLMAFPFVILRDRGHIASYRIPSNQVKLTNPGDEDVGIRVLFQALGDVSNPRITLNDDQFVQINVDMRNGDTLDVCTDPNDIYVVLNGANAMNRTDKRSQFFQVPVGESLLSYQVGQEFDVLAVTVYFTPVYLGV